MFYRNDKYIYFALIPIIAITLRCFLHIALQQNEIVSPLKFYKYYTNLLFQLNFQYFFSSRAQIIFLLFSCMENRFICHNPSFFGNIKVIRYYSHAKRLWQNFPSSLLFFFCKLPGNDGTITRTHYVKMWPFTKYTIPYYSTIFIYIYIHTPNTTSLIVSHTYTINIQHTHSCDKKPNILLYIVCIEPYTSTKIIF